LKKNVLIVSALKYKYYIEKENSIIDKEKHNTFIIIDKKYANDVPSSHYLELFSVDINDSQRVLELAKTLHDTYGISKVISLSEKTMILSGLIRDYCNAKGLSSQEAENFRNKYNMKKIVKGNLIKAPDFTLMKNYSDVSKFHDKHKKTVIKPIYGMGSKETYIIDTKNSLEKIYHEIEPNREEFLMEEFIEGEMYHCDSIVKNGEILLSSVSKYLNPTLEFNSTGYLASVMIDNEILKNKIKKFNKDILRSFNLRNGVTHLELFKTKDNELVFCEIAARAGGAGVVPSIDISYSVNLLKAGTILEVGQELPVIKFQNEYSGWIVFHPQKGKVLNSPKLEDFNKSWIHTMKINIKEGQILEHAEFSTDNIASFIISANTQNELEKRIQWIKENFKVTYDN